MEDDAGFAEEAIAIGERLEDADLASYAYWPLSIVAFAIFDYDVAYDWAMRRFSLVEHIGNPDKLAHIHYYGATAALAVGRLGEAERLVRKHDEIASRLSPHQAVHALSSLLFVQEHSGTGTRPDCFRSGSSPRSPRTQEHRAYTIPGRCWPARSPAQSLEWKQRHGGSKTSPARLGSSGPEPGSIRRACISRC